MGGAASTVENVKLDGLWQFMVELATCFLWKGTGGTEIPGGGRGWGWGETIPIMLHCHHKNDSS